jgi:hypothetical protein
MHGVARCHRAFPVIAGSRITWALQRFPWMAVYVRLTAMSFRDSFHGAAESEQRT